MKNLKNHIIHLTNESILCLLNIYICFSSNIHGYHIIIRKTFEKSPPLHIASHRNHLLLNHQYNLYSNIGLQISINFSLNLLSYFNF